jgi:hypothetical protein
MGGGAMPCVFSSSALFEILFLAFRPTRLAISVLPSVVSDGSPGSCTLASPLGLFSFVEERSRFAAGGLPVSKTLFFLLPRWLLSGAVDSPSSPEASRDEGCSWSMVGILVEDGRVEVRFRFPPLEPVDDGDDIVFRDLVLVDG